jgi:uncharacterized membrane protein YeaQ/YmgE (transglycosylase-associated protein family)
VHGRRAPRERVERRVTPLTFVTWIVVAVVTAWSAGRVVKHGGYGLKSDILLGLMGSGAACGIVSGIDMSGELGLAATVLLAIAGACAMIALQRRFFAAPLEASHARRR